MSRAINYLLVSLTLSTILCTILLMSTYSRPSNDRYKNGRFWRAPIVERSRNQVLTKAPEYYVVEEPIITDDHIQIDIVELNEGIIFLSPAKLDESDNIQIPLLSASPEPIIEFEKYQNEKETTSTQESTTDLNETTTEDEMTSESTSSFPDVATTTNSNEERSNDQNYDYHKIEDLGQASDPCHGADPGFFDVLWCLGHRAYNYVKSAVSYWLGY